MSLLRESLISRWRGEGGYGQVLSVGLPLVASMASTTVMHFTDRMFLANYSVEAISAATPAGITSFLFISFFMGVVSYVNVFVAQYVGAGRPDRVGASLWQGIYFSLLASLVLAALYFLAGPLFSASGHPAEVQRLEVLYFRILTLGAGLVVLGVGLSCFYSGQGLTRAVMLVNLTGAAVNIPLDYALINGVWGFPRWGIQGAALATVVAQAAVVLLYVILIFRPLYNRRFQLWRARALDRELFARLMRFGLPGGVQFFLDMFAITFFVFMVGRLGKLELAATNIVLAIDTLAFLPMVGFSVAVSTLVGQAVGAARPCLGVRATQHTLHITMAYMVLVAAVFVAAPDWLLNMFRPQECTPREFTLIKQTGVVLLRFVAVYSIFDALAMTYFGALKGAGDIWFVMWAQALVSAVLVVLPVSLGIAFWDFGLYQAWTCLTAFVASLGLIYGWRFRTGRWREMSVIEKEALPGGGGDRD